MIKRNFGKYKDTIITDKVVLTDERILHIKKRHSIDYEKYSLFINEVITNPDYILDDLKNKNTILMLKKITILNINLQLVIKLNVNNYNLKRYNSIITFLENKR